MFYLDIIFNNDKTFITYEKSYYMFLPHSIAYSFIKHIDLDSFLLKSYNYIFIFIEPILFYNLDVYCVPINKIRILNVCLNPNIERKDSEITNVELNDINTEILDIDNYNKQKIKHTKILMTSTINSYI